MSGEEWRWRAVSWEPCIPVLGIWSWRVLIREMMQSALHFSYVSLALIRGAELKWTRFKTLWDRRRNRDFEIWQSWVTKESYLTLLNTEFYPQQYGNNITYFLRAFCILLSHRKYLINKTAIIIIIIILLLLAIVVVVVSSSSTICYSD